MYAYAYTYVQTHIHIHYVAFKLDQNTPVVHLLRALYLGRLHDPTPHYAHHIQSLLHRSHRRFTRVSACPIIQLLFYTLVAGGPFRRDVEKIPVLSRKIRFIAAKSHSIRHSNHARCPVSYIARDKVLLSEFINRNDLKSRSTYIVSTLRKIV